MTTKRTPYSLPIDRNVFETRHSFTSLRSSCSSSHQTFSLQTIRKDGFEPSRPSL
nr:MAG TPA: Cytochrome C' [Bacteriophage sp.]